MRANALDVLQIIADDKRMILYRPEWRKITDSITAAILLQQILFLWNKKGRKPFYKFKNPCSHKLYQPGDSWTEELGFSRAEFDRAIEKIGYKRSKNHNAAHTMPVEYWIDASRLTHYTIHEENLLAMLEELYPKNPPVFPCQNGECPVKQQSDFMVKQQSDVTKSDFSTLDQKRESDVRKIKKVDFPNKDQRSSSEKKISSESETNSPALALFEHTFPNVRLNKARKREIVQTVTNIEAWKLTLWWWELKEYRAENTENVLDYYANTAVRKLTELQERQAASQISSPQNTDSQSAAGTPGNGHGNGKSNASEWERVQAILQQRLSRPDYATWIAPVQAAASNGNGHPNADQAVTLHVPDPVFEYWITEHYQTAIQDAYTTLRGNRPTLVFQVANPDSAQDFLDTRQHCQYV